MLVLERRPSDFESPGPVVGYSGASCCCCCCLHWAGALVGGVVGLVVAGRKGRRPLHPRAWRYLLSGFVLGLLLTAALIVAAGTVLRAEAILAAFVFVPSLAFIGPGLGMIAMGEWHRIRRGGTPASDGLNCLRCRYDLRSHFREQLCPGCGAPALPQERTVGADDPGRATWRGVMSGTGLLLFAFCPAILRGPIIYAAVLMGAMGQRAAILIIDFALLAAAVVVCWIAARRLGERLGLGPGRGRTGWLTLVGVAFGLLVINVLLVKARLPIRLPGYAHLVIHSIVVPSAVAYLISGAITISFPPLRERLRANAAVALPETCLQCGGDLSEQIAGQLCPECGVTIDWARLTQVMRFGLDYGREFAWKLTWMSVLWSTLLSIVGYLLMLPFFLG
ncbi:MAG: hypothetical protein ACYTGP_07675 [Planctomycetota bacterium]|jgi:hypothetical protein